MQSIRNPDKAHHVSIRSEPLNHFYVFFVGFLLSKAYDISKGPEGTIQQASGNSIHAMQPCWNPMSVLILL